MTASYHPAYRPRPRSIVGRLLAWDSRLRRLDGMLLVAVLLLSAFGALLVWSATRTNNQLTGGDGQAYLQRQVVNLVVGLLLGAGVIGYGRERSGWRHLYLVSLVGLAAVLSPLGRTHNGSHSWISLGGLSMQPAELAKVVLCICLAALLAGRRHLVRHPGLVDVVLALAVAAIPMGLVVLQPDFGTVMVFAAIVVGVLAVSGVAFGWLVGLGVAAVAVGVAVVQLGVLEDYQLARFAGVRRSDAGPEGRRLQRQPGADRHRGGRADRQGPVPRQPDERSVRAGAAHRLHLHRRGRGARPARGRGHPRAAGDRHLARLRHRSAGAARRRRRRDSARGRCRAGSRSRCSRTSG